MGRPARRALSPAERMALHQEGIAHFNAGRYFEAHDAWERIWRSPDPEPADLFQGLIQVAVAFHHLRARHRPETALRVLGRARRRLAGRPDRDHGLAVDRIRSDVESWLAWLETPLGDEPPSPVLHRV